MRNDKNAERLTIRRGESLYKQKQARVIDGKTSYRVDVIIRSSVV
jgi:hypothetical protein